jgi:hypothetical protein
MSDLPWFKFDADAWLGGTISQLPLEARGLFIHACALYWRNDCVLSDGRLFLGVDRSKAEAALSALTEWGLLLVSDGSVSIPFLDSQAETALEHKQRLSEAGRRGGQARLKRGLSEAQATLKPPLSHPQASKNKNKNKRERGEGECREGGSSDSPAPPALLAVLIEHGCCTHDVSLAEFAVALEGVDVATFIPWAKSILERDGPSPRYARQFTPLLGKWREHLRFQAAVRRQA